MYYTIDRFEEAYAVLETPEQLFLSVKREQLPPNSKEGDLLVFFDGIYQRDEQATAARAQRIAAKMAALFED